MGSWFLRQQRGWEHRRIESAAGGGAPAAFGRQADGGARLATFQLDGLARSAIVAPLGAPVFVNGEPVLGGLRLLEHRDEVILAGERLYFSAESKPQIVLYEPDPNGRLVKCALCRLPLAPGQDMVVHCPQCGRIFHQVAEREGQPARLCWTFRPSCLCGHPTPITDEPIWQPGEDD